MLHTKSMNFSNNGVRIRTPTASWRIAQLSSYTVTEISREANPLQQVTPNFYNIHTSRNNPETGETKGSEACGTLIGKSANQVTQK
jgi:hypothetical protein